MSDRVSIDSSDYSRHAKAGVRNWMWKKIARCVPDAREAFVIYLAGADDLDRPVAERLTDHNRRCFRPDQLLAVSADMEVVKRLRKAGTLAIRAKLSDVLAAWPSSKRCFAVVGDFTSGLEMQVLECLFYWVSRDAFYKSLFALNLQRGREAGPFRDYRSLHEPTVDLLTQDLKERRPEASTKHRGIWAWYIAMLYASELHQQMGMTRSQREEVWRWRRRAVSLLGFQTYTSASRSSLRFDSVILGRHATFNRPAEHLQDTSQALAAYFAHVTRRSVT